MKRDPKAFTLIELIAVLVLVAIVSVLIVACTQNDDFEARQERAEQRREAQDRAPDARSPRPPFSGNRTRQNAANLRTMAQAMHVYANTNNSHFPGLNREGRIIPGEQMNDTLPASIESEYAGDHPATRLAILVGQGYIDPVVVISPFDDQRQIWDSGAFEADGPDSTGHYSYALLGIADAPEPHHEDRRSEWRDTANTGAIIASDAGFNRDDPHSLQTGPGQGWRGHTLRNDTSTAHADNHADHSTQYGSSPRVMNDNLFETGEQSGPAFMVFSAPDESWHELTDD